MNSTGPGDSTHGEGEVSRAYAAAGFDEEPPAHLDRTILAAAHRRPRPRFASFVPALALAATVVLSFSLVLRTGMIDIGRRDAPTAQQPIPAAEPAREAELDALSEDGGFADAPAEEGVSSATTPRRERALNEAAPAAQERPSAPPAPAGEFSGGPTPELRRLQEVQTLTIQTEESAALRSSVAGDASDDCSGVRTGEPQLWAACITRQLQQGAEEAARAELEAFTQVHPDYPLPEELRALGGP